MAHTRKKKYYVYDMFGDIEGNPILVNIVMAKNKKEALKKLPKNWQEDVKLSNLEIYEKKFV